MQNRKGNMLLKVLGFKADFGIYRAVRSMFPGVASVPIALDLHACPELAWIVSNGTYLKGATNHTRARH
jgi:hypothetical protein